MRLWHPGSSVRLLLPVTLVTVLLLAVAIPTTTARAEWELGAPEPLPAVAGGPITHVRCPATDAASGLRAEVRLAIFDARRATFRVLDQPTADDRRGLGEFLRGPGGAGVLAAVNGGYFHPDYAPLGLRVTDGRVVHPLERAALLSGLLLVNHGGVPALLRRETYQPSDAAPARQALQAGPFLVDSGRPVPGLNAQRPARRTAVLTDGRRRWALAVVPTSLTLAETGALLARPGLLGEGAGAVRRALNLDGGSSTALWVKTDRPGGESSSYDVREWGVVRDFLAVVAK